MTDANRTSNGLSYEKLWREFVSLQSGDVRKLCAVAEENESLRAQLLAAHGAQRMAEAETARAMAAHAIDVRDRGLPDETTRDDDDAARYRYLKGHLGLGWGVKLAGADPHGFAGPTLLDEALDAARGAVIDSYGCTGCRSTPCICSQLEPTVSTESDCSTGTGGVTLVQMAENIKLGLDPYKGSSEKARARCEWGCHVRWSGWPASHHPNCTVNGSDKP